MNIPRAAFSLSDKFLSDFKGVQPKWGPLGWVVYLRTYSLEKEDGSMEEWWETCQRVVEATYQIQHGHCIRLHVPWNTRKSQRSAQEMYRRMFHFKWLPPGRGIAKMGSPGMWDAGGAALNNPLDGDTRMLTKEHGWVAIKDICGQDVTVLTSNKLYGRESTSSTTASSLWAPATISDFEKHPCLTITSKDKAGVDHVHTASINHRWFRRSTTKLPWERVCTEELRVGDYMPTCKPSRSYLPSFGGQQHGFFFGAGTRSNGELHQFGDSIPVLSSLFTNVVEVKDSHSVVRQCPLSWGSLPEGSYLEDPKYVLGFLQGYFAADGTVKGNTSSPSASISSSRKEELYAVIALAELIGIRMTPPRLDSTSSNFSRERELWASTLYKGDIDKSFFLKEKHRDTWVDAKNKRDYVKITSIVPAGIRQVYCATVPDYEQFTIEGFVLTSNCGFASTKDIGNKHLPNAFSEPFSWTMTMSMLGVGCGFDTRGSGTVKLLEEFTKEEPFQVGDSREGWAEYLSQLLQSFIDSKVAFPIADYSLVRHKGAPIQGFGGTASGPGALATMTKHLVTLRDLYVGKEVDSRFITDVFCAVGECVVAGGTRRCMPAGTLVNLQDRVLPIEQVRVGDVVMSGGEKGTVIATECTGSRPLLEITHRFGKLRCTPEHRVGVLSNGSDLIFKEAKELAPGDRLAWDLVGNEGTTRPLPPFTEPLHFNALPFTIPAMSTDVAWFLGLVHGDGHVFQGGVSITANYEDAVLLERAQRIVKSEFNLAAQISQGHGACKHLRVHSRPLGRWLLQHVKQPHAPIHIPSFIAQGTVRERGAYLAGLFDADDRPRKDNALDQAFTKYHSFADEVVSLAQSLGIAIQKNNVYHKGQDYTYANLHVKGVTNRSNWFSKVGVFSSSVKLKIPDTTVTGNGSDFSYTHESMGKPQGWYGRSVTHTSAVKHGFVAADTPLAPSRVLEVVALPGASVTYDIEVAGIHRFTSHGVVVHNSALIALGSSDDDVFANLKNYKDNPDASNWPRWAANNSVFADSSTDFSSLAKRTALNGEPGYYFLENAQKYGRMIDPPDYADEKAIGGNPCFTGDTKIAVADGRHAVSFKQLAEEGKDVPVYSIDPKTGVTSIKWGRKPRITQRNAELVRVTLEDGTHIDCTPNHRFYLKDLTWKEAKDLQPNDSLSRFTKRKEIMKKGGQFYWRVYTKGGSTKGRIMEHRMVAKFSDRETFDVLYDSAKSSGWCKGGLVVHHKDYDGLNNSPDNLEWMTFKDHAAYHAQHDRSGTNNGMFGREHTEESKALIGAKTDERCKDPGYRQKLSDSHGTQEREEASARMVTSKAKWDKQYYLEQEAQTDLDTLWVDGRLFVNKCCEICETSFTVPWGKRARVHCSTSCSSRYLADLDKRKNNQLQFFSDRQKKTLHDQVTIYKDLKVTLSRDPSKKEWEQTCKESSIALRFRNKSSATANPYALTSFTHLKEVAASYNHRVASVVPLTHTEDVYCITTDDNHTIVVIPDGFDVTGKALIGVNTGQCLEQTLEDRELCCLVETFPSNHDSLEDYIKTLKYAYLYAKTVTLVPTHSATTNAVMLRNRRIGCSQSGIQDTIEKHGMQAYIEWCDSGYAYLKRLDKRYSDWLAIPLSIKLSSTKPSGTISKLPGIREGIHESKGEYELQSIRLHEDSKIIPRLRTANIRIEVAVKEPNTVVAYFPMHYPRTRHRNPTMWEQLELAAIVQGHWADNQVSITVDFDPETEGPEIQRALEMYSHRLKGVSFLPRSDHGYEQAPKTVITKEEYEEYSASLLPLDLNNLNGAHEAEDKFCDGGVCEIPVG